MVQNEYENENENVYHCSLLDNAPPGGLSAGALAKAEGQCYVAHLSAAIWRRGVLVQNEYENENGKVNHCSLLDNVPPGGGLGGCQSLSG